MRIIVDACPAINLLAAQIAETLFFNLDESFYIGSVSLSECESARIELTHLIDAQVLNKIDAQHLDNDIYMELLDRFNLGLGETECLTYGVQYPDFVVCSDDRKARNAAKEILGAARVTGSIGLLKRAVESAIINREMAFGCYQRMVLAGAFLPSITSSDYF